MVKSYPDDVVGWPAPRGGKDESGAWLYALPDRPAEDCEGRVEVSTVANYQSLANELERLRASKGWSLRDLAREAGVSLSVAAGALSGSGWPRWTTLEACASALGSMLSLAVSEGPVVPALLALLDGEAELTGSSVAAEVVVRPNTLYDLRKFGRAPSSSTVLALAAWFDSTVEVSPLGETAHRTKRPH